MYTTHTHTKLMIHTSVGR